MATTTDLEKLVINYLTQDQYDDAREAGTLNANELYLTPDTGSTGGTVTSVAVANGGALSVSGSPITTSGTITISHADTSSQSSVSNSGRTYIQSVTLDTYGHVTGLTSASESVTNTDENMKWTASTSSNTYYPLQSTSTATTSTANTLNGISFYQYYNTAGGYRRLDLGNATSFTSTGGAYGTIRLYGAPATYYGDLVPGVLSTSATGRLTANRTWTFPDASGTVALTSDIPDVSGFITSDSDYRVQSTPLTTATTYYLLGIGNSSDVTSSVNKHASVHAYVTADTSTSGYAYISLGNNIASGTAGAKEGYIRLYGMTAYYHEIKAYSNYPTANRIIYLPRYAGTMYLTCVNTTGAVGGPTTAPVYVDNTGTIQQVTSIPYSLLTGTPTIPSAYTLPVATYNSLGGVKPWKSYTGSASGPTAATASTAPTVNSISTDSGKYYAVEIDKDGRMFVNVPWTNVNSNYATTSMLDDFAGLDDLPTITLNGTETVSPNFYAPTSAGTDGYYLKSNGSGAPTWAAIETGGTGTVTTWYGTCGTTASTAAKVVTCSNFALSTGAIIGILFTTANTAATPTLNVNSTGAKSIYVGSSTPSSTTNVLKWSANTMLYFMYDGTYFRFITAVAAASVVPPTGANTWYGTSSTTATTAAKTSTIDNYVLTKGSLVSVTFSTANTYVAGAITLNINSTGAKTIYYNNAATSTTNTLLWDAGETLTFMYSGSYYYFIGKSAVTAGEIVRW